jgi:epoxyqueuosine reductase
MQQKNYSTLKETAIREGMALFGVADVTSIRDTFLLPENVIRKFPFGISLGFRLSRAVLETVVDMPNQIYYFHYQRANILLDQTALKITAWIQGQGYDALPIPASQIMDWDKQIGSVSHREIARLAGLGWYGRNNLMVNPLYGSQVRYVTILTDAPLKTDTEIAGACGACRRCVAGCPAAAITDKGFDRNACHMKLKEFTKIQRIGQMICGVCVKACYGTAKDF